MSTAELIISNKQCPPHSRTPLEDSLWASTQAECCPLWVMCSCDSASCCAALSSEGKGLVQIATNVHEEFKIYYQVTQF